MRARNAALFFIGITLAWSVPNDVFAATDITDDVVNDTEWDVRGSPYVISSDLTIQSGATLTIDPGVVVQFDSDGMYVFGRLLARGTSDKPILFTSAASSWYGINFFNQEALSSLDNIVVQHASTAIHDYSSKDLLISNARVENSNHGIVADGSRLFLNNFSAENISSDALDIDFGSDVTLKNITLENVYAGVEVYVDSKAEISNLLVDRVQNIAAAAYVGSSMNIASSTVTNVLNSYGAVEVFADSSADISNLIIDGVSKGEALNIFDNSKMTLNNSSISNTHWWGTIGVFNSGQLIARNVKVTNGFGDGIYTYAGGFVDIQDSLISGFAYGAGIADYGSSSGYPANSLSLTKNEITNNDTGIGLYADNSSYAISNNSIHGNASYGLASYGMVTVDVSQNFWGDPSGPYNNSGNLAGTGDEVISYVPGSTVIFSPWLSSWGTPPISNVLFLPGIEGSRLYYRDMIGGVIGIEHQVWEPDYHTDIPYLAMNTNGTSKYQLYTKDIVDMLQAHNPYWNTIAGIFGTNNLESYSGFEHFMDGLIADGTVKEWRAYPYDWRYDVRDIVNNGTSTKMPDGSIQQVYLADVLRDMAATSSSGKVTIVAHSNGGLLAKALAISLGADAPKYIDRVIMVGTPQWGTPSSIGAMLHGDGGTQGFGIITNGSDIRAAAETMPGTYGLLPTSAYFSHISDPVATFNTGGMLSSNFAINFGAALTSFTALANFITDSAGLDATAGSAQDLRTPLALSSALVDKATATHSALDSWTPPVGITVTAIAGWGQDTVKTLAYTTVSKVVCTAGGAFTASSACADTPSLQHTPVLTQDGDDTVVSPSAFGDVGERLYFDANAFRSDGHGNIVHQNLTTADPIENTIKNLLTNVNPNNVQYIVTSKPPSGTNPITLRISSHSPVNLVITDADGNQSGVLPMPGTDFAGIKRDIPSSSVQVVDDEQYINVPQSGTYQVVASGYAAGSATLNIETVSDSVASTTSSFTDIPTATNSTIAFSIANGKPTAPAVDVNGDGAIDFTVVSSAPGSDPLAYVRYMRAVIKTMSLAKNKNQLDEKLGEIERQLASTKKSSNSNVSLLTTLAHYVEQQVTLADPQKGIPATTAEIILGMINQLKALL